MLKNKIYNLLLLKRNRKCHIYIVNTMHLEITVIIVCARNCTCALVFMINNSHSVCKANTTKKNVAFLQNIVQCLYNWSNNL